VDEASQSHTHSRTRSLAIAALLAALMAATSWIAVPFGPVPFTLQTMFVMLTGLLLAPGWAAVSMALYLALGVAGLPVFSAGQGGVGMLLGPTGGFLWSFPVAAALISAVFRGLRGPQATGARWYALAALALLVGEAVIYLFGVPWLVSQTGMQVTQALVIAVIPFLMPDVAKAILAALLARAIDKALQR
jgi:biotin transport system substrate-specific component